MATIQASIKLTDGMTPALQSMNRALNIVLNSFEQMQKVSSKAVDTKAIQTARSELSKAQVSFNKIEKEINENRIAQEKFNNSVRGGTSAANGLWSKLKSLAGVYLGFQTVKSVVGASDTYTSNTGRLNLITGELEKTRQLQQEIYEASQRSRTSYTDMTNAVAKLGITAKRSFNNTDEMVAFAEILNKQFKIAGTGAQEQSSAMYQLTQAMAAGKLQGDEFRSILENAPLLAQSIAKEMGVLPDKLKEMSSEGKITADIIKNALFNSAEEINELYKKLPMTFSDVWTQVVNKVNKGLEPLYRKLGEIWNNPNVQNFINSLVNGFLMVTNVCIHLFEILSNGFALIYDNWGYIEPILIGLATAYLPTIVSLLWAKVTALWSAASAWAVVNWHILVVAAVIAALIVVGKQLGITFVDVCSVIAGAFMWCWSAIVNAVATAYNTCLHIVDSLANAGITAAEVLYNAFNNGFTGWIAGVKSALWSFVGWAYGIIKPLVKVWDKIKGTNIASELQTKIDNNISKGTTSNYKKFDRSNLVGQYGMKTMNPTAAYNKGAAWGADLANKIGFNISDQIGKSSADNLLGSIGKQAGTSGSNPLDKIANNTGKIADNTSELATSKEDLSYMRDLAEQEAINRYTMTDLKIEMNNNNNINSDMDLDTVVGYLQEKVYEGVLATAEGLHF